MQVKIETPPSPQIDLRGTGYCASFNFRRTTRAVTRLFDLAFQPAGIRSTQFTILVSVAKTQPTSISALADLLVIDPTTLTRNLRLMEQEGLLAISTRSTKRQRFVTLTQVGQAKLAQCLPAWREMQQRSVEAVGSENWLELRNDLEKLAQVAVRLEKPASTNSVTDSNADAPPATS